MPTTLIGHSQVIQELRTEVECASKSDAKVLITGESGVGKEVVARMIHERSRRSRQPLVTINCAGIPDSLLASELFGHVRGSFTDAHRDRTGLLEQADRGSVFLDEIGEMSLQMQALLLRFLENGEIQRVGSERLSTKIDVRVITATNRVLSEQVDRGAFREDLYYRLNVLGIEVPALRARREDILPLVNHFIASASTLHRLSAPVLTDAVETCLLAYDWPGNVRELRNVAERLVVRSAGGRITLGDLPSQLCSRSSPIQSSVTKSRPEILFELMTKEGRSFWGEVHQPFMSRDLTRDDVREVVRIGLVATRGSYRLLTSLFNMPDSDYKRFMAFLRKHHSHLPVHEFRSVPVRRTHEPAPGRLASRSLDRLIG